MSNHEVKACGKAHAWCRECRPDARWVSPRTGSKKGRVLSAETRARMSAAHVGVTRGATSDETRERISAGLFEANQRPEVRVLRSVSAKRRWAEHFAECDGTCSYRACHPKFEGTDLEHVLWTLLSEFPTVERQTRFGKYHVDAYLPEYRLAFEADGDYWHGLPGRAEHDARRDAEILERFGVTVVRLTEGELRDVASRPYRE